ncbi:MAG TPA: hypothetical protein VGM94_12845 [Galbitalea sp.]|jgi:hypothetical protein
MPNGLPKSIPPYETEWPAGKSLGDLVVASALDQLHAVPGAGHPLLTSTQRALLEAAARSAVAQDEGLARLGRAIAAQLDGAL